MTIPQEFQLPEATAEKLKALTSEMRDFLTDATDAFDSRSEKWQESEEGQEVETWLRSVEDVVDSLETMDE